MDAPLPSPNLPNPNLNPSPATPEAQPAKPAGGEQVVAPAAAEAAPAVGATPAPVVPPTAQPVADPMALAMSQPTPPAPAPVQPAAGTVPMPNLAADVDVIEPEWVDKAEDVVRQHMGDPYGEEEAVEALQEDYLQKRYGFTVHEPGEDTTKTDSV